MKPPFNMLKACFWLLAALMFTELSITMMAAVACAYGLLTKTIEQGSCAPIRMWAQEIWAEMLAAILALLLASRGAPPNGKGGDE